MRFISAAWKELEMAEMSYKNPADGFIKKCLNANNLEDGTAWYVPVTYIKYQLKKWNFNYSRASWRALLTEITSSSQWDSTRSMGTLKLSVKRSMSRQCRNLRDFKNAGNVESSHVYVCPIMTISVQSEHECSGTVCDYSNIRTIKKSSAFIACGSVLVTQLKELIWAVSEVD